MLMSLLCLATSLEDPFDNAAPDAVSFSEAKAHILFVSEVVHLCMFVACVWGEGCGERQRVAASANVASATTSGAKPWPRSSALLPPAPAASCR